MWPALVMALVGAKMQNDKQKAAYRHAQKQQLAGVEQDIAARRASRAGDSGYMQAAMSGMQGGQGMPPSASGPMLASIGSALASQTPEPQQPTAAQQTYTQNLPNAWAGNDFDEDLQRYA
jgi:glucose dehydrogenase